MPLPLIPLAIGGASFLSNWLSGRQAERTAEAQAAATQENIAAMQERFAEMQEMMSPYTQAGEAALQQQQAMMGLMGPEAQQAAIAGISESPLLQDLIGQGEEAMLQRGAATGGLRGGNIQGALAQYRPQMVNQAIQQRFGQLGGLASAGLGATQALGAAGMGAAQTTAPWGVQAAGLGAGGPDSFLSALLPGLGAGLGAYTGLGGTFGGGTPPSTTTPPIYGLEW